MSSAPTNEFPFIMTTTPNMKFFSFNIGAAGKFVIDWGDGNIEKINKNLTGERTISHSYKNAAPHEIKLGGKATGYDGNAAISFYENTNLAKIDGSLGQIFGTLSDGTQPRFGTLLNWSGTFQGCTNLNGEIPAELFSGISGTPATAMFYSTFQGCSGLTGSIPENLFAEIYGAPASHMFYGTFDGCSGLTGSIPENLFAGISGAPAEGMFLQTFYGCSGLSGTMDKLGNIKNKKAPSAVTATKKESKPVVAPEFKPMPDMGMTGTISVDMKISGITPDDLAKIIQMACSACNKPNIQITSDIVKHIQQNNPKQR